MGGSGPSAGILALLSPAAAALWSAQQGGPLALAGATGTAFAPSARPGATGAPDAPPSHPSPAPNRPQPPTQAPAGATASAAGGGFFSGAFFSGLLALMGLAALRMGPLVMASARLRPQAYIALLERPG